MRDRLEKAVDLIVERINGDVGNTGIGDGGGGINLDKDVVRNSPRSILGNRSHLPRKQSGHIAVRPAHLQTSKRRTLPGRRPWLRSAFCDQVLRNAYTGNVFIRSRGVMKSIVGLLSFT